MAELNLFLVRGKPTIFNDLIGTCVSKQQNQLHNHFEDLSLRIYQLKSWDLMLGTSKLRLIKNEFSRLKYPSFKPQNTSLFLDLDGLGGGS